VLSMANDFRLIADRLKGPSKPLFIGLDELSFSGLRD
jgi:hypothetical protein